MWANDLHKQTTPILNEGIGIQISIKLLLAFNTCSALLYIYTGNAAHTLNKVVPSRKKFGNFIYAFRKHKQTSTNSYFNLSIIKD